PALRPEVALDAADRVGAALRQRRRPLANLGLRRAKRRRDPLAEVEVEVPRFEVLEDVRHVHARTLAEVAARAGVDEAEGLMVGDHARAESILLRRREAEEELRGRRDQVGTRDARRLGQLLRQALPPAEAAPDEPTSDARHVEQGE